MASRTGIAERRPRRRSRARGRWGARAVPAWLRADLLSVGGLLLALWVALGYAATLATAPLDVPIADPPLEYQLTGFYGVEQNFQGAYRWSMPQAAVALPIAVPGTYRVRVGMQFFPADAPGRVVTVLANGRPIATVPVERQLRDYTFTVEPTWHSVINQRNVGGQLLALGLEAEPYHDRTLPIEEQRALGVVVTHVRIEPVDTYVSRLLPLLAVGAVLVGLGYALARLWGLARPAATLALAGIVGAYGLIALGGRAGALVLGDWLRDGLPWLLASGTALTALALARRRLGRGASSRPDASPRPGWVARVPLDLPLALLLIGLYGFVNIGFGYNQNSRLALTAALVEQGSTRIDDLADRTGDKAFLNGHWYSDKAPGTSLLAVPGYAAVRAYWRLRGGEATGWQLLRASVLVAAALPTAATALLLRRMLRAQVGGGWALAITLAYALGTLAFPYASSFFGHAASAAFLFAAFFVLWRAPERAGPGWALAAGLLAGCAVVTEFPTAIGVACLLGYAFARDRRAPILMAVGALPAVALLLGYNWLSFGSPLTVGYDRVSDPRFAEPMSRGIMGVTWPKAGALWTILLGTRGLLRLAPWLALAPLAAWSWRGPARRELALCAGVVAAFLAYNAGYYLPLGGTGPGPRFLVPAIPFLAVLVAHAPRPARPLVATMAAIGAALILTATLTVPVTPQDTHDPLANLWLPSLREGAFALNTAGLHWALGAVGQFVALAAIVAAGLGSLILWGRPGARARPIALALTGGLLALTLAFSFPADLLRQADAAPRWIPVGHAPPAPRFADLAAVEPATWNLQPGTWNSIPGGERR